jgi:hypothetical protein
MANPVPAIIEAIGAHLDGWQAKDGRELLEFIDALPDLIEKLQETTRAAIRDMVEGSYVATDGDTWPEQAEEVDGRLVAAQAEAAELARVFREENDFWIGDD